MERYNYEKAVENDVREWIKENSKQLDFSDRGELEERLNEELWITDSVTGNASGSYTFSTWEAEENLCHNFDLLGEALQEFGCGPEYITEKGPEACDVTIRCYLLGQSITAVLDDYYNGKLQAEIAEFHSCLESMGEKA